MSAPPDLFPNARGEASGRRWSRLGAARWFECNSCSRVTRSGSVTTSRLASTVVRSAICRFHPYRLSVSAWFGLTLRRFTPAGSSGPGVRIARWMEIRVPAVGRGFKADWFWHRLLVRKQHQADAVCTSGGYGAYHRCRSGASALRDNPRIRASRPWPSNTQPSARERTNRSGSISNLVGCPACSSSSALPQRLRRQVRRRPRLRRWLSPVRPPLRVRRLLRVPSPQPVRRRQSPRRRQPLAELPSVARPRCRVRENGQESELVFSPTCHHDITAGVAPGRHRTTCRRPS